MKRPPQKTLQCDFFFTFSRNVKWHKYAFGGLVSSCKGLCIQASRSVSTQILSKNFVKATIMVHLPTLLVIAAASLVWGAPAPVPEPTAAPDLAKRATTCTFSGSNGASLASKSKTSCSTIILSALAVPSGVTLDLTGLKSGTNVSPPLLRR
jgi:hypothetical protein